MYKLLIDYKISTSKFSCAGLLVCTVYTTGKVLITVPPVDNSYYNIDTKIRRGCCGTVSLQYDLQNVIVHIIFLLILDTVTILRELWERYCPRGFSEKFFQGIITQIVILKCVSRPL